VIAVARKARAATGVARMRATLILVLMRKVAARFQDTSNPKCGQSRSSRLPGLVPLAVQIRRSGKLAIMMHNVLFLRMVGMAPTRYVRARNALSIQFGFPTD
jgi:hypothetical protein